MSIDSGSSLHGSGLPFPAPGDLPNPGIKLTSPALAGGFFTASAAMGLHGAHGLFLAVNWILEL